jgi:hypothetical protein
MPQGVFDVFMGGGGGSTTRARRPGHTTLAASALPGYDAAEVTRALWATAELFERLERACAERLGMERVSGTRTCGSGCTRSWAQRLEEAPPCGPRSSSWLIDIPSSGGTSPPGPMTIERHRIPPV